MFKRNNSFLSIDLSNREIRWVKGRYEDRFIVDEYSRFSIKANVYSNGRIIDFESFEKYIKDIIKTSNFKGKNIGFIISSDIIASKRENLPKLNNSELEKFIDYQASDFLNLDKNYYYFDYLKYFNPKKDDSMDVEILGLEKIIADELYTFLKKLKFNPLFLDIRRNGQVKLLSKSNYMLNKAIVNKNILLVDTRHSYSEFLIIKNKNLLTSRITKIGEDHLFDEFSIILDLDKELFLEMLIEGKIDEFEYMFKEKNINLEKINLLKKLINEIEHFIMHFRAKSVENNIDYILFSGNVFSSKLFFDFFCKNLDYECEIIVEMDSSDTMADLRFYNSVIGSLYRLED